MLPCKKFVDLDQQLHLLCQLSCGGKNDCIRTLVGIYISATKTKSPKLNTIKALQQKFVFGLDTTVV